MRHRTRPLVASERRRRSDPDAGLPLDSRRTSAGARGELDVIDSDDGDVLRNANAGVEEAIEKSERAEIVETRHRVGARPHRSDPTGDRVPGLVIVPFGLERMREHEGGNDGEAGT